MNIFWLSHDPTTCAEYHADIHLRKMILEYAQLLSTAHHVLDGEEAVSGIYKKTHVNHPCAKWVRESATNYHALFSLFKRCGEEYEIRFSKSHKTIRELSAPLCCPPKSLKSTNLLSPIPLCMPDEFKFKAHFDCVEAYRDYYFSKRLDMKMQWTRRTEPHWWGERLRKFKNVVDNPRSLK